MSETAELVPFAALDAKSATFINSIAEAKKKQIPYRAISGLTVPHHLLAADLLAGGFMFAAGNRYEKIVVVFPDHFKKTRKPFATSLRPYRTVLGDVPVNRSDVIRLLRDPSLVEDSDLFEKDHGIGAVLPYVRHFFPGTPVVPIAVSLRSNREQCDALVAALDSVITPRTLVIQSTDFSHYLPHAQAIRRDQEVLNILSANAADAVLRLIQPDHLDSRGAQYIQMRLQAKHFGARPIVLANSNQQLYAAPGLEETTSYVVQIYGPPEQPPPIGKASPFASAVYCFAGDTFFGRDMARLLARPGTAKRLREEMTSVLNGCPLIINLEGVMVAELPTGLGPLTLAMPADMTLEWLRALNVVAVSLANNHARDLGDGPRAEMEKTLERAGIRVLRPGVVADLGDFRLAALTDLDNRGKPGTGLITSDAIVAIGRSDARPPVATFLHWGVEGETTPGAREQELADKIRQQAVSLIIGAHPHQASSDISTLAGGEAQLTYSLGNFLFDQMAPVGSGAILELSIYPQGTFFTRLVKIPNFYDRAHATQ